MKEIIERYNVKKEKLNELDDKMAIIIFTEDRELVANNPDPVPIMRAYYFATMKPKKLKFHLTSEKSVLQ